MRYLIVVHLSALRNTGNLLSNTEKYVSLNCLEKTNKVNSQKPDVLVACLIVCWVQLDLVKPVRSTEERRTMLL